MAAREVRTLGQFQASEQKIDCDCTNYWVCSHSGPLRLDLAINLFGPEFDFYTGREQLSRHVFCSLCAHYHPTFRLGWKTPPARAFAGSHGAGVAVLPLGASTERQLSRPQWQEPEDFRAGGSGVRKFGPG